MNHDYYYSIIFNFKFLYYLQFIGIWVFNIGIQVGYLSTNIVNSTTTSGVSGCARHLYVGCNICKGHILLKLL